MSLRSDVEKLSNLKQMTDEQHKSNVDALDERLNKLNAKINELNNSVEQKDHQVRTLQAANNTLGLEAETLRSISQAREVHLFKILIYTYIELKRRGSGRSI
jgi:predicted nuclease with TOPRIM domain